MTALISRGVPAKSADAWTALNGAVSAMWDASRPMTNAEQAAYIHYAGMVKACYCKKCPPYRKVGARGIGMSKRWRESFQQFYTDMGPPQAGQTLQRKNSAGPFNKDNVYWG